MGFRLGSIPVRIHFSFFMTAVLLSGRWNDPMLVAEWAVVVLVSVMIHELGHALMGIAFGLAPQIDLHGMGGTTSWTAARGKITPAKSILISVAGPFAGIFVGAAVFVAAVARAIPDTEIAKQIATDVIWVNGGWGFVNLLPVLPMDGGSVLFTILNAATKGKGERPARVISIGTAVVGGLIAYGVFKQWWPALLAGLFAYDNVRALRALSAAQAAAPTPIG